MIAHDFEPESGRVGGGFDGAVKAAAAQGVEDRPGGSGGIDRGKTIELDMEIQDAQFGFVEKPMGIVAVITLDPLASRSGRSSAVFTQELIPLAERREGRIERF
jgi:hypothetical protein